ncbi:MAG: UUP1 family membrane protein [Myxococcota bacterium]
MRSSVLISALALCGLGLGLFLWKHVQHDMPIVPDPSARVWRLDWTIPYEATSTRTRIEFLLPEATPSQAIVDEYADAGGLRFAVENRDGTRVALWEGNADSGEIALGYSVRVHLPERTGARPPRLPERGPATARRPEPPVDPAVARLLDRLGVDPEDDPAARVAQLFAFVANEIEAVDVGPRDPRYVLANREGDTEGRHVLLRTLLRAAGLDAQLRRGLRLPRRGSAEVETFVEVAGGDLRRRLSIEERHPNTFPEDFVVLSGANRPLITARGAITGETRIDVLREERPPDEMASFVAPSNAFLRATTLYRLPVATREVLRVLLVVPFAVLIAALFRNLVGLRTFGTFMPVLIGLSIRDLGLTAGFLLIGGCLALGVVGRLALDRLRLLFVPRVCLLLCLVILTVTALAQVGHAYGLRDLGQGLLFPIVILAMLIERISVSTLEEGWLSSARLLAGSLVVGGATYPIFRSETLAYLFFGFPELVLVVMGLLVAVGGYTGYRLAELWRFRSFLAAEENGGAAR